jgi:hypothetical protein
MMALNLLNTGGKTMLSDFETLPIESIAMNRQQIRIGKYHNDGIKFTQYWGKDNA